MQRRIEVNNSVPPRKRKYFVSIVLFLSIVTLIFLPTCFEKQLYLNAEHCWGIVLETNDAMMLQNGLFKIGEQHCRIKIGKGTYKGEEVEGVNYLNGHIGEDKVFKKGDKVLVLIEMDKSGAIRFVNMLDH